MDQMTALKRRLKNSCAFFLVANLMGCGEANTPQPPCSVELCTQLAKQHNADERRIADAGYEHCLPIAILAPVNMERSCREDFRILDCGPHVRVNGYAQLNEIHAYYLGPDDSCWDGGYHFPPTFKASDDYSKCPGNYSDLTCKRLDEIEAYKKMNAK